MASRQEKEKRAEKEAALAAADLREANLQREREEAAKLESSHDRTDQQQQHRPGILGSIQEGTKSLFKAVTGKTQEATERADEKTGEAAEKAKETKERAKEKTGEAAEKAREMKGTAKQKTEEAEEGGRETKDSTKGKLEEYKDYTAEKAKEAKDAAAEKARAAAEKTKETKDSAAEKTRECKDAAAEKAGAAAEKTKETKDSAIEKAKETKDSAAEKAKEMKDSAREKATDTKDATVEKAREYKDYTAEKAQGRKETTVSKLGELKDSAAGAARKAVEMLTGKKEDDKAHETEEAAKQKIAEQKEDDKEEPRKRLDELKLKDEGYEGVGKKLSDNPKDDEEAKGTVATGSIFGALGSATEAIKKKLTKPTDVVEETHADREQGGTGRVRVVDVEDTLTGEVASALKEADQMTGQSFNDVGRIDGGGVAVVKEQKVPKRI